MIIGKLLRLAKWAPMAPHACPSGSTGVRSVIISNQEQGYEGSSFWHTNKHSKGYEGSSLWHTNKHSNSYEGSSLWHTNQQFKGYEGDLRMEGMKKVERDTQTNICDRQTNILKGMKEI